jgi:Na+/proline symporter
MASTLAAPFVLGVPAEIYLHGTMFALLVCGYLIGVPLCTHFFFTRFYEMGISSIYEVCNVIVKPIPSCNPSEPDVE